MECFDIHSYSYRSIDKKLRLTAYSQLPTNFNPRTSNFSKLNTNTSILTLNHQPSTQKKASSVSLTESFQCPVNNGTNFPIFKFLAHFMFNMGVGRNETMVKGQINV